MFVWANDAKITYKKIKAIRRMALLRMQYKAPFLKL